MLTDRGAYTTLHSLFRKLPPSYRTGVKKVLGTQGHGRSNFDWLTARKDATGKKRLDRALQGMIDTLGQEAAQRIAGKVCVDFGAGYVPTDGVVLWLLGAREVYGVDYNDIAKPNEIARAVRAADVNRVRSQLQALPIDAGWSERLDRLTRWSLAGDHAFPPGYTFVAPADVIGSPLLLPRFDVLVSTSVLEHIRPSLMTALMDALKSRENDHAIQIHCVDLRDHRDFDNAPYEFLDPSSRFDAEIDADSRGNGMTVHAWEELLTTHPEWGLEVSDYAPGRVNLWPGTAPMTHVVADSLVIRSITAATGPETRGF